MVDGFFIMQHKKIIAHIVHWLKEYSDLSGTHGFVIGISGGIDSAITSTLCALTRKKVLCVNMPIHQSAAEYNRANEHISNLKSRFSNVDSVEVNLSDTFETMRKAFPRSVADHFLAMANTRSRLRMSCLYALGQEQGLLVAGTGNKIEDFGIGFYTKYGDGGVDLSPIADLSKTQVFELAKELEIVKSIQEAKPTDGLWSDGRSDEDQIGASYPELEWAMEYVAQYASLEAERISGDQIPRKGLSERQEQVLGIFLRFHNANKHKMLPIPVCVIPKEYFH